MPNQYDKERAAAKVLYASGKLTYAAYQLELCLIACDERQDPRACIECQQKVERRMVRRKKGKKS